MKIISDLNEINEIKVGATIGNFDGVHLGHQNLVSIIKDQCQKNNLKLLVLTFIPHPSQILRPSEHSIISSYSERRHLLESLGVDYLYEVSFTRDFSTKKPKWFLDNVIGKIKKLEMLFLGHDFAFGANKSGTFEMVKEQFPNLKMITGEQFLLNNETISSTKIRNFVKEGDVEHATAFLGRPFSLSGRVIKGDGRGRSIGFPTANIFIQHERLIPARGVYITKTKIAEQVFDSVTNIGFNPTFKEGTRVNVETNIFNFERDIYGEEIEVFFYKKIRDENKFPSVEDLKNQIKKDVSVAKEFFS